MHDYTVTARSANIMRDSRDHTVPSDAVRAIGRFNTDPTTYRAREPYAVDAPVRATRKEAMADIRRGSVPSLFDLLDLEETT